MGNFFNKMFRREASGVNQSACSVEPQAKGGSYANNVRVVNGAGGALSVSAWYRALELRANTMSQLVMEFQQKRGSHGGNYECYMGDFMKGDKLNYKIQIKPNPLMTWPQLVKQAEILRVHQGNAVIYIERESAASVNVSNLWLCSMSGYNMVTNTYQVTYNTDKGAVTLSNVPSGNVIHLRNTFSNDLGLTGVPTLKYASKALTLAATNDNLVTETAAKGMRQKLLVQEDKQGGFGLGRASKKELEKVTDQLDKDIADKDVILLSNIASVTPISTNLQQQEINQIRAFSVAEIARYLGVPKIMLMASENESYKTPEAATQEFLLRTIQPLSHDWETEFNAKLIEDKMFGSFRFKFNDDSLMRLDPMGRANIGKVLMETGVKCVNELRKDYDLPAVEGGDRHYVSTNLQPVDAPVVGNEEGGNV